MNIDELKMLGLDIDKAIDSNDSLVIQNAILDLEQLKVSKLPQMGKVLVSSYIANAYSALRSIEGHSSAWSWESELLENEIYNLRVSLAEIEKIPMKEDNTDLRFRIETNLANALNFIGRFSEANEHWVNVIRSNSYHSMAIGNLGYGLYSYASSLYDEAHQIIFLSKAHEALKLALEFGVEQHAEKGMQDLLEHISSLGEWDKFDYLFPEEKRGRSKVEREYRTWCLRNRLFLNPLNDLGEHDVAANDVLQFPSIFIPIQAAKVGPPEVYGIYNQLKQEYVSARYTLFEAIKDSEKKDLHFSDKRVKLINLLDYRVYNLWLEKLKMAYLSTYAIFDKLSYLINLHWQLNLPANRVTFRNIWYQDGKTNLGLNPIFVDSKNWPLRGLFWLSKDLFYTSSDQRPIEPEARMLHRIRNHIAHKYLTVHELTPHGDSDNPKNKDISYQISKYELISHTIKLLKLVRNALIYLSLGAHCYEIKIKKYPDEGLTIQEELLTIEDIERI